MKRIILLIFIIALAIVGFAGIFAMPQAVPAFVENDVPDDYEPREQVIHEPASLTDIIISFSHEDTFYDHELKVELFCSDPDVEIYYTLTCEPPDKTSRLYTRPITLTMDEKKITAPSIRAVAYKNGKYSQIFTNSYVLGNDVHKRFTPDTYIFVLTADPYDLYDHHNGIAIKGFLREQYILETGDRNPDPPAPANFNLRGREGEREFYVEVYDNVGNTLVHQAAGGRVAGGWSRDHKQKTWRLIARNEYSDGKFRYPFFDDALNYNGQLITKFDRLTLRNSANDRGHAFIRDEIALELAKQAGYPYTQASAPAAVFLNGDYYGFAWLKEAYSNGYLEQMYGGNKENYQIVQNNERGINNSEPGGEEFAYNDWDYVYQLASDAVDANRPEEKEEGYELLMFTNDEVFEDFCSGVDLDNLMLFYAIQTYIDNRDWPNNNMKMWRYYPSEDEIVSNPCLDGKWRFLMFDVEFALGIYGNGHSANTLRNILSSGGGGHMGGSSRILRALMQREDMQEKFANTVCDLISGAFAPDNAISSLEKLIELSEHELEASIKGRTVSMDMHYLEICREQIREFAQKRPNIMLGSIQRVFEIPEDKYKVKVHAGEGADIWLNTRRLAPLDNIEFIETEYFTHYNIPLKAELHNGYEFSHWEINGIAYDNIEVLISSSMGGNIEIKLFTNKIINGLPLYISELKARGGADYVILSNPNETAVSTKPYYLSDTIENLKKWKILPLNIKAGESLLIVAKNNKSQDALMKPQMNFSLKAGETLYLSDVQGEILDTAEVPEMEKNEVLKRAENGTYHIVPD